MEIKTCPYCGAEAELYKGGKTMRLIDTVPVVRGEWKLLDECSNAGVYCSVCHKAVFRERAWYKNVHIQSKFCPNCGAKMESEGGT